AVRSWPASGAGRLPIDTAAHSRRRLITEAAEAVGAQAVVVNIDGSRVSAAGEPLRWEVFSHVGHRTIGIDALEYAKEVVSRGAGELLVTSQDPDGTQAGYDLELTRAIA